MAVMALAIKTNFSIIFALLFISEINLELSDYRLCGDKNCKALVAKGITTQLYNSKDHDVMSFKPNIVVDIYSFPAGRKPEYYGVEVNGKRGYVPKSFIKETSVIIKREKLIEVSTESTANDSEKYGQNYSQKLNQQREPPKDNEEKEHLQNNKSIELQPHNQDGVLDNELESEKLRNKNELQDPGGTNQVGKENVQPTSSILEESGTETVPANSPNLPTMQSTTNSHFLQDDPPTIGFESHTTDRVFFSDGQQLTVVDGTTFQVDPAEEITPTPTSDIIGLSTTFSSIEVKKSVLIDEAPETPPVERTNPNPEDTKKGKPISLTGSDTVDNEHDLSDTSVGLENGVIDQNERESNDLRSSMGTSGPLNTSDNETEENDFNETVIEDKENVDTQDSEESGGFINAAIGFVGNLLKDAATDNNEQDNDVENLGKDKDSENANTKSDPIETASYSESYQNNKGKPNVQEESVVSGDGNSIFSEGVDGGSVNQEVHQVNDLQNNTSPENEFNSNTGLENNDTNFNDLNVNTPLNSQILSSDTPEITNDAEHKPNIELEEKSNKLNSVDKIDSLKQTSNDNTELDNSNISKFQEENTTTDVNGEELIQTSLTKEQDAISSDTKFEGDAHQNSEIGKNPEMESPNTEGTISGTSGNGLLEENNSHNFEKRNSSKSENPDENYSNNTDKLNSESTVDQNNNKIEPVPIKEEEESLSKNLDNPVSDKFEEKFNHMETPVLVKLEDEIDKTKVVNPNPKDSEKIKNDKPEIVTNEIQSSLSAVEDDVILSKEFDPIPKNSEKIENEKLESMSTHIHPSLSIAGANINLNSIANSISESNEIPVSIINSTSNSETDSKRSQNDNLNFNEPIASSPPQEISSRTSDQETHKNPTTVSEDPAEFLGKPDQQTGSTYQEKIVSETLKEVSHTNFSNPKDGHHDDLNLDQREATTIAPVPPLPSTNIVPVTTEPETELKKNLENSNPVLGKFESKEEATMESPNEDLLQIEENPNLDEDANISEIYKNENVDNQTENADKENNQGEGNDVDNDNESATSSSPSAEFFKGPNDNMDDFHESTNYVEALGSFIQMALNSVPDPLHSMLMDLSMKGVSPKVTVFTAFTGILILTLISTGLLIQRGSKENYFKGKLCTSEVRMFKIVAENQVLKEELESSKLKVMALEESLDEAQTSVHSSQEQLKKSKQQVVSLESLVTSLQEDLETSADAGLSLNNMLSDLLNSQSQSSKLHVAVQEMQAKLSGQQKAVEELREKLGEKELEVSTHHSNYIKAEEQVESLQVKLFQSESHLAESQEQVSHYSNECSQLELNVRNLELIIKQHTDQSKELNSRLLNLTDEVDLSNKGKLNMENTLKNQEEEIKTLNKALELLDPLKSFSGSTDEYNENMKKLLDVSKVSLKLEEMEGVKQSLEEKLGLETEKACNWEAQYLKAEETAKSLETSHEILLQEKIKAQTELEVLSNYFKDSEMRMQKELGVQEALRQQKEATVSLADRKAAESLQEVSIYKSQIATFKEELENSERSYKNQLAAHEKKAHESWLTARLSERKMEDSKQEASVLRQRLTLLERELEVLKNPADSVLRPIPTRPLGPNGDITFSDDLLLGGPEKIDVSNKLEELDMSKPRLVPFAPIPMPMPPPPPFVPPMFPPLGGPLPPPPFMHPPFGDSFGPPEPWGMPPQVFERSRRSPPSSRGQPSPPYLSRNASRQSSPPPRRIEDLDRQQRTFSPGSSGGHDYRDSRGPSPPPHLSHFYDMPPPPPMRGSYHGPPPHLMDRMHMPQMHGHQREHNSSHLYSDTPPDFHRVGQDRMTSSPRPPRRTSPPNSRTGGPSTEV